MLPFHKKVKISGFPESRKHFHSTKFLILKTIKYKLSQDKRKSLKGCAESSHRALQESGGLQPALSALFWLTFDPQKVWTSNTEVKMELGWPKFFPIWVFPCLCIMYLVSINLSLPKRMEGLSLNGKEAGRGGLTWEPYCGLYLFLQYAWHTQRNGKAFPLLKRETWQHACMSLKLVKKIRSWDTGCIQSVTLMKIPQSLHMYFFLVLPIKNSFEREGVGTHALSNHLPRSVRANFPRKGRKLLFSIRSLKPIAFVVIPLPLSMLISCPQSDVNLPHCSPLPTLPEASICQLVFYSRWLPHGLLAHLFPITFPSIKWQHTPFQFEYCH